LGGAGEDGPALGSTIVGVAALEGGVTRAPQFAQNIAPGSSGASQVVQFIGGLLCEIADCRLQTVEDRR
jgi:hypothetical protein